MKTREITTKNAEETRKAGRMLAREVLEAMRAEKEKGAEGKARLICLRGDLGSGKTTFVQGMAQELGVKETVNSPTFLIMKKYALSGGGRGFCLYHFDMYRIREAQEILDLGWKEILEDAGNIVVAEWPEKIEGILSAERIDVRFEAVLENERRITFIFHGEDQSLI